MTENTSTTPRRRVLSGMRPTGRLHLGNYMGALYNWVKLQHEYECYFFIADYHALTTDYAEPGRIRQNTIDVALDFLAAGLDPQKCTIFVQSHVPQHAELHLLFSMFTPLSWLERVPTYKDQQEQLKEKELNTYGFLGYPLLQSADILLYKPNFVPVGQDQVAHVELTREVSRKFDTLYGPKRIVPGVGGPTASIGPLPVERDPDQPSILPEPQVLLTPSPKLPGTDGRKMSKSYGNTILMTDPEQVVRRKLLTMTNGGQREKQTDTGDPEICPVGDLHRVFSSKDKDTSIRIGCKTATIGCRECKLLLNNSIMDVLNPFQATRFQLELDLASTLKVLDEGAKRAGERAEESMVEVRRVMGISRNLYDAQVESSFKRNMRTDGPVVHKLDTQKDWWFLDQSARAQNLRSYWLSKVVSSEVILKQESDRVFITSRGKRVLISTARERDQGIFTFDIKPKTYEILVLLCWDKDFDLHDFVVPQKVYVEAWSKFKKSHKGLDIHFSVQKLESSFDILLPESAPVKINEFQSNYNALN